MPMGSSTDVAVHDHGVARLARARPPRAAWSAGAESAAVWAVVLVVWMLSFASYSPVERAVAPLSLVTLDWVAVAKVATRIVAFVLLGAVYLRMPRTPARQHVMKRIMPFGLFAAWAIISTTWSPLWEVSLGHGAETVVFVMLAAVVGVVCAEDRNLSRILFHLTAATLVLSIVNAGLWAAGLSAGDGERASGFLHPNLAAQVAGIGLVVLVSSYLIAGWRWTHWLLAPAAAVQGWVLFAAQSRTANGATFAALLACLLLFAHRRSLLLGVVALAVLVTGYLTFDPETASFGHVQEKVVAYVVRGQSNSQFLTATGRTEMWAVGWQSFKDSLLVGHGNWVMTATGAVPVWGEARWQTSHNLVLHVLTGTGLVGAFLLLWALWRPGLAAWHELVRGTTERKTALFVGVVFAWFLLVGLYELSLLGPVSPATLTFFVVLGMAAGRLP